MILTVEQFFADCDAMLHKVVEEHGLDYDEFVANLASALDKTLDEEHN